MVKKGVGEWAKQNFDVFLSAIARNWPQPFEICEFCQVLFEAQSNAMFQT